MEPSNAEMQLQKKLKKFYLCIIVLLLILGSTSITAFITISKYENNIKFISDENLKLQNKIAYLSVDENKIKKSADENKQPEVILESICINNEPWATYTDEKESFKISYPTNKFIRFICPGEGLLLEPRENWENIHSDIRIANNCGRDRRYDIELISQKMPYEIQEEQPYYKINKESITLNGGVIAEKLAGVLDTELMEKSEPADSAYFGIGVPEYFTHIYFHKGSTYYMLSFEFENEELISSILNTLQIL